MVKFLFFLEGEMIIIEHSEHIQNLFFVEKLNQIFMVFYNVIIKICIICYEHLKSILLKKLVGTLVVRNSVLAIFKSIILTTVYHMTSK